MPPRNSRKRQREEVSGRAGGSCTGKSKSTIPSPAKATATSSSAPPSGPAKTGKTGKKNILESEDDDDDSELSSLSSDVDFEDVPLPKRAKIVEDSDDDDIEFEDVVIPAAEVPKAPQAPVVSGDLELNLERDNRISLTNTFGRKGPSKLERRVRVATHSLHVLFLLWHNAIRNAWLCDEEVQATMLSHIPPRLWDEIDRWRRNSGLEKPPAREKGKNKNNKGTGRTSRDDWGQAAKKLEEGAVDMSHGDPLFRLMQSLISWWKQRFRVNTPGLRKWGYMPLERLDRLTKARRAEEHDAKKFGERIRSLEEFRSCARRCEGSRDVGAQLFTALLRGLGMEARMAASLQPLGFGWSKMEEADPEKEEEDTQVTMDKRDVDDTDDGGKGKQPKVTEKPATGKNPASRRSNRTTSATQPIMDDLDDEMVPDFAHSDLDSDIDIPPPPKKAPVKKKCDDDLQFPHYWTEVLSPVTHKYLPVDAIVKKVAATNRELIESLEPRGGKADKTRQVIAYVVGFSADGTAKDVTVRYLKSQRFPGKTKGVRMPLEKIPVYNRRGKIKRHDYFDWFKTAMSGYTRGGMKYPITEIDNLEDAADLQASKVEKKQIKEGEETLQFYKTSPEYVLERHLKREEALLPDAAPVRVFKIKSKGQTQEENVYLRSDVVQVKSAETWHKQGRAPTAGHQPLKQVPYRAATIKRKVQIAEAEKATGQKVLQGLYSLDQTDWIIPPPIRDGKIPKNEYGNIDLFVEHMCPEGAVHVPYRGAVRVCKRLGVDFAEAVIDFEFGHRMAVPVIQGVVIAEEYYEDVMEELRKDEIERTRKEDEKRRKAALSMWRRLLKGMRIMSQLQEEYGSEQGTSLQVFGHHRTTLMGRSGTASASKGAEEEMGGGFLPEGYEEDEDEGEDGDKAMKHSSAFFPVVEDGDDGDGSLVVDDGPGEEGGGFLPDAHLPVPEELPGEEPEEELEEEPKLVKAKPRAATKRKRASKRRRRRKISSDEEDDFDDDDDDDDYRD